MNNIIMHWTQTQLHDAATNETWAKGMRCLNIYTHILQVDLL